MTRRDIATLALRLIGVSAHDEPATADEIAVADAMLTTIYSEIVAAFWTEVDEDGVETTDPEWTLANIPASVATPLAQVLAADVAPVFSRGGPSRGAAWVRLGKEMFAPQPTPEVVYF